MTYEALRSSFREINNMLTDAQSWDVKHKLDVLDRQNRHTMLLNQLDQQRFSNSMRRKEFELRQAGDLRAAEKVAYDIEKDQRDYDLTVKKYNLMQSDKKLAHEDRMAVLKANEPVRQMQLLDAQTRRDKSLLEAKKLQEDLKEVPVNLPLEIFQNKNLLKSINQKASENGLDIQFDERGNGFNSNGEPAKLPIFRQKEYMNTIRALSITYDNKPERVQNELQVLTSNIENIKSKLNSLKSNPSYINVKERGLLKRSLNLQQSEIDKRVNYLENLKTTEGKIEELDRRAAQLRKVGREIAASDIVNGPKNAKPFFDNADDLDTRSEKLLEIQSEENIAAENIAARKAAGVDKTLETRSQLLTKKAIVPGAETLLSKLTGDQNGAINALDFKVQNHIRENNLNITTEREYKNIINIKKRELIKDHNEASRFFNEKLKEYGGDTKEFRNWLETVWKPLLLETGFEYIPKRSYSEQIGQSY